MGQRWKKQLEQQLEHERTIIEQMHKTRTTTTNGRTNGRTDGTKMEKR